MMVDQATCGTHMNMLFTRMTFAKQIHYESTITYVGERRGCKWVGLAPLAHQQGFALCMQALLIIWVGGDISY